MRQLFRWGAALAAILALWALAQGGLLASLDSRLGDWRLEANSVPSSGSTLLVEIDSKSLEEVGVWPWPRTLYASLLDRLMEAGADEVAFDIDFSSTSTAFDDAIFAAALEQAGGYAWLAAFAQADTLGAMSFSRPLPEFSAVADAVLVNVLLDPVTGRAERIPVAAADAQGTVPALAVQLARPASALPSEIEIDFSIDTQTIRRVSFTDVLYGRVDPAVLTGKQVIVGASAIELRDFFTTPRYGVISGPLLQALALETLKTGRLLTNLGVAPGILVTALLAVGLLLRRRRLGIPLIALSLLFVAATGEALAFLSYGSAGVMVDTASLHIGLLLLLGLALADNGYHHLLARRSAQQRLHFLATHDSETGLLSRQGLFNLPDTGVRLVLVLLQIKGLDELRATLGSEVVEPLLARFAHRLGHAGFQHVARTAPCNFALVDLDDGDSDRLAAAVRQLKTGLSGIYTVAGHSLHIEVIAGYAAGSRSRTELLNQAEIALIHARSNRLPTRGFTLADQQALDRHSRLDRDLRQAMDRDQLHLVFQPQVDLRSRRITGAETLLRWTHPELGIISPAEFIPLAEETGLIVEIGRWVMWEACKQAMLWPEPVTVAVNVSPVQFQQADMEATAEAALRRSGLPASRLELELTESESIAEPGRVHAVIGRIQELGVRLSIDDFGTGYSSLSYFRDLPFDIVKIDQSFVRGRTTPTDLALLRTIIGLADSLGKITIAEGIEDEETAERLAKLGCTLGQGYHFSRPIPSAELSTLLSTERHRRQG